LAAGIVALPLIFHREVDMLSTPMQPSVELAHFLVQPDMEGDRLVAYKDGVGIWTLGAGATRIPDGNGGTRPVVEGDTCTYAESIAWEESNLTTAATAVNKVLTGTPKQWEFDAFTSLTFNIGVGNLQKVSAVGLYNAGDIPAAAQHFLLWNKAGGVVENGLTKRSKCEAIMILGQPWQIAQFSDDTTTYANKETLARCMEAYQ